MSLSSLNFVCSYKKSEHHYDEFKTFRFFFVCIEDKNVIFNSIFSMIYQSINQSISTDYNLCHYALFKNLLNIKLNN